MCSEEKDIDWAALAEAACEEGYWSQVADSSYSEWIQSEEETEED